MRRWAVTAAALLVGLGIGAAVGYHREHRAATFRLAPPTASTIRALGLVRAPYGRAYLGGWCQAPCATYTVRGTVVSVQRSTWYPGYGYVLVLRDGATMIAGRMNDRPDVRAGDQVQVSGVLFFPTPPGRDGGNTVNGAELSPIYRLQLLAS